MIFAAQFSGFLEHVEQDWPFPRHLTECTLVSTQYQQSAVSSTLYTQYNLPMPQAAEKRQAEFLAARLCAREALRLQLKHAQFPSQKKNSRAPVWPYGSCGSMSHSHPIAAAIVGSTKHWKNFGLDIEPPISITRSQRLAKAILTTSEHKVFSTLSAEQAAHYLTLVFSFKESLFKALNPLTDCYFGFHDAQVTTVDLAEQGFACLKLNKNLSRNWRAGHELEGQFTSIQGNTMTLVGIAKDFKDTISHAT